MPNSKLAQSLHHRVWQSENASELTEASGLQRRAQEHRYWKKCLYLPKVSEGMGRAAGIDGNQGSVTDTRQGTEICKHGNITSFKHKRHSTEDLGGHPFCG